MQVDGVHRAVRELFMRRMWLHARGGNAHVALTDQQRQLNSTGGGCASGHTVAATGHVANRRHHDLLMESTQQLAATV